MGEHNSVIKKEEEPALTFGIGKNRAQKLHFNVILSENFVHTQYGFSLQPLD